MRTVYSTKFGKVYQADCLEFLQSLRTATVDTLFADPPFNLNKQYGKNGGDDLPVAKYLEWSKEWIAESVRVLTPGGALFLYNLPKWLIEYGTYLNSFPEMTFKHWIAVDKAHSLPIPNRLSPSHYGLLYYIKGKKPRVFNRDFVRTPIQTCRHCGKDVRWTQEILKSERTQPDGRMGRRAACAPSKIQKQTGERIGPDRSREDY